MARSLFFVVVIGIVIGIMLPSSRPAAPARPSVETPTAAAVSTVPPPLRTDTVLRREQSGHFIAFANVNSQPIRFIVDTGADTVALTMEDARRAGVTFDPGSFSVVGRGAGGPVRGQEVMIGSIELDGKRADNVRGVVLDGATTSLLGHTYLRSIDSVEISNDKMTLR